MPFNQKNKYMISKANDWKNYQTSSESKVNLCQYQQKILLLIFLMGMERIDGRDRNHQKSKKLCDSFRIGAVGRKPMAHHRVHRSDALCSEWFFTEEASSILVSRTIALIGRGRDCKAPEFQPLTWLLNGQSTSLQGRGPVQPGSDDHGTAADRHRGDEHPA